VKTFKGELEGGTRNVFTRITADGLGLKVPFNIEVVDSDLGIKMIIINTLVAVNAIYIYIYIFYNFHIDSIIALIGAFVSIKLI
jgi:hypothetical protein